uniref:DUF8201 domain-containing protein n=1 Tax=Solibacter usitatus (strain Ellin6076) TaxID=234267 RepID=Q02BE3_SOLUE
MPSVLILIELTGIVTILAGWGFLSTKLLERLAGLDLSGFGWFELAVLGTAAAYVYAAVLVIFFPLGSAIDLLFATTGVVGFVQAVRVGRQESNRWAMGVGVALTILVAAGTVHTAMNYDAGLYYLQHAKVLESDGMIPGLANVHSRFGFNSAILTLSAVFHGPVFGRDGLFLVGPALFLVFTGAMLEQVACGLHSGTLDGGHFFALFGVTSWLVAFNQTVLSWFGLSPSGDLAAAAATLYCPVAMVGLCRAFSDRDSGAYQRYAVLLPAAAAFAITAKLATAPIALVVVLPFVLLRPHRTGNLDLRAPVAGLACSAVVLSLWGLHNLLLSGCLVYPVSGSCVGWVPWAVDPATVESARDSIRAWARAPGEPAQWALNGWGWLAAWQRKMLPERQFLFILLKGLPLLLVAALVLRISFRTGTSDERDSLLTHALICVWTVNVIGLAYWFISAPDPRFGLGFMLGTIASSAALVAASAAAYRLDPTRMRRFAVVVSGVFLALLLNNARLLAALPASLQVTPWRTMRYPKTRYTGNGEGFTIAVPLDGDQCWDTATLCTPEVSPRLTRTRIWGLTAYVAHSALLLRPVSSPEKPGSPPESDLPQMAPTVSGAESTTQRGLEYSVRWLQQRTEFKIQHEGAPRPVKVSFRVATYQAERQVWLEHDGQALPVRQSVRKSFWDGGDVSVANTVTLHTGENRFTIVTDGSAVDVTPGRPVFLLLVGGIDVADSSRQ